MDRPTAEAPTPRLRHAVLAFGLLTAGYVAVLMWIDARNPMFEGIGRLLGLLPPMAGLSAIAYLARYARWRRLLGRAGHPTAWGRGLLAYLAGFAFTATPGKVGELVRMRYLGPLGVPNPVVLGAFVFERALDLLVVLALALLAIGDRGQLSLAVAFVGPIGFIGLVAPHIARMIFGEDHRFYLPASALIGALVLSMASVASKNLVPGVI
ncbi:MAG: iron chelate uptake ABC transporter family permease subunit, partial [Burkholderiales bacterium]